MRLKADRRRSKHPHRLDAEIAALELELYRLRGIRRTEITAARLREPLARKLAGKGSAKAWKNPAVRAARIAGIQASWTPERREAQRQWMLAVRADPVRAAAMLAAQRLAQRTPEYRARVSAKNREVAAQKAASKAAALNGIKDPIESALFGDRDGARSSSASE